jgi:hypothetical protein
MRKNTWQNNIGHVGYKQINIKYTQLNGGEDKINLSNVNSIPYFQSKTF